MYKQPMSTSKLVSQSQIPPKISERRITKISLLTAGGGEGQKLNSKVVIIQTMALEKINVL